VVGILALSPCLEASSSPDFPGRCLGELVPDLISAESPFVMEILALIAMLIPAGVSFLFPMTEVPHVGQNCRIN
jgi:hypothetical protein